MSETVKGLPPRVDSSSAQTNGTLINGTNNNFEDGISLEQKIGKTAGHNIPGAFGHDGHDDSEATEELAQPKERPQGLGMPIEDNVFYNEETLKYMRIIDMYKKLGVGKDIELPRVSP
jgi:hypothetical protein